MHEMVWRKKALQKIVTLRYLMAIEKCHLQARNLHFGPILSKIRFYFLSHSYQADTKIITFMFQLLRVILLPEMEKFVALFSKF